MHMPATCLPSIALSRPSSYRLFERAAGVFDGLRLAWQRRDERRRLERQATAIADMNEVLLRDMGAPEWMISQAAARRESAHQRLLEVHHGSRFDY
jgi:hypothetical protein